jgi:hypothetical protein
LQEEVDNKTIALAVKTTKLTAKALAKAFEAFLRKVQKELKKAETPQGRQTVKKLMNHGQATSTIPLDGETRLFDKVARKWGVDYSFHETGPKKYLLLFKSGQADAITACLADYTKLYMARTKDKRPRIKDQLRDAGQRERSRPPREQERKREVIRNDR